MVIDAPIAEGVVTRGLAAVGVDLVCRASASRLLRHGLGRHSALLSQPEVSSFDGDIAMVFALKEAVVKALRVGLFSRAADSLRVGCHRGQPVVLEPLEGAPHVELGVRDDGAYVYAWALVFDTQPSATWRWSIARSQDGDATQLPPLEQRSCSKRPDPSASVRARNAARKAASILGAPPTFRVRLDSRGAPHLVDAEKMHISLTHDGAFGAALVARQQS
jgi:phosphopantetheinyl transferase (holo-ACP synthase)